MSAASVAVLVCVAGGRRVAVPVHVVQEVTLLAATTVLPESPPWLLGVLDVHGTLVPVLDVGSRFERCAREASLSDTIIVCTHGFRSVGLLVEEVRGITSLSTEPPESVADLPHATYVRGVLQDDDGAILLLDIAHLVASSDLPPDVGEVAA